MHLLKSTIKKDIVNRLIYIYESEGYFGLIKLYFAVIEKISKNDKLSSRETLKKLVSKKNNKLLSEL